jgi:arabinogalactan endo-1,4-beta-galactosidase
MMCLGLSSCSNSNNDPVFPEDKTYDMTGVARGADVSWLTEMESSSIKFYDANGRATDCLTLLRSLGMNSIRLRVFVNPTNKWCNQSDVVAKAYRAAQLGLRIMIDFHYSDTWADPSSQTKPSAWADMSLDELKTAVTDHTTSVLNALKAVGVTPEWVQVGNETNNGMLWDDGKASDHMDQYAALSNAGYDAVKAVFPNALVIIHLAEGNKASLYTWMFDGLKNAGAKWDVIGMSLYPESNTWETLTADCVSNIKSLITRYNCKVMLCEVGMAESEAAACKTWLTSLMSQCKSISGYLGTFYWEPECYGTWNSYGKGAFDDSGKPTEALDAFAAE